MSARDLVFWRELAVDVHACEVQQCVLVVWAVVGLDFVVISSHAVVSGIHDWLNRVQLAEKLLTFVQALLASCKIAE